MVSPPDEVEGQVLEHVARYRLTDAEILSRADVLEEGQSGRASIVLEGLAEEGWLDRSELCPEVPGHLIYCLTPRAAKRVGHDAEFAKPLRREARVEWYAIAKFCCCGETDRQLFTKDEFREKFRELWYAGQPVRYYLEPDGSGSARLAFVKVDNHGTGRWERLIDSCNRFLRQRMDTKEVSAGHRPHAEAYERLVNRGKFQFSVLTALAEKKRSIELEVERRQLAGEWVAPIQVYVVPGLFDLLFPASGR